MSILFSNIDSLADFFRNTSQKTLENSTDCLSSLDLKKMLQQVTLSPSLQNSLQCIDLSKPYGRRVIYQDDFIEIMVATWTPQQICAPHDHGGSWSAISILRGQAQHTLYTIKDEILVPRHTEYIDQNAYIVCHPNQIHAMGDSGKKQASLMTLHAYSNSIPFMMVYDDKNQQTIKVDGSCGAWVPDNKVQIIKTFEGFVHQAY